MKCKNCEHDIVLQGTDKDQEITHRSVGGGAPFICSCGCEKPERRSIPIFCKNCGHEVKKRKGKWVHIIEDVFSASGRTLYVGNISRSTNRRCRTGFEYGIKEPCGCENPEGVKKCPKCGAPITMLKPKKRECLHKKGCNWSVFMNRKW